MDAVTAPGSCHARCRVAACQARLALLRCSSALDTGAVSQCQIVVTEILVVQWRGKKEIKKR
jgi:hypothetical protein